ncbi:MAG: type II secretion system protein [Patescibacteria group bacterium]
MRFRSRRDGFTMVELMVSIVILVLISTTTVFSLTSTRNKDELNTAARMLASDIRNIQARALAARNVYQCTGADGKLQLCGADASVTPTCVDACTPLPPPRFCLHTPPASQFYQLYADIRGNDWRLTDTNERLINRSLALPGGGSGGNVNMLISNVSWPGSPATPNTADICVSRQSGTMRINACGDAGLPACTPTEPQVLTVTLRHNKSGESKTIEVNAVTGRVSIQ